MRGGLKSTIQAQQLKRCNSAFDIVEALKEIDEPEYPTIKIIVILERFILMDGNVSKTAISLALNRRTVGITLKEAGVKDL
jgi:ActR/RegA family two-component response regulator